MLSIFQFSHFEKYYFISEFWSKPLAKGPPPPGPPPDGPGGPGQGPPPGTPGEGGGGGEGDQKPPGGGGETPQNKPGTGSDSPGPPKEQKGGVGAPKPFFDGTTCVTKIHIEDFINAMSVLYLKVGWKNISEKRRTPSTTYNPGTFHTGCKLRSFV